MAHFEKEYMVKELCDCFKDSSGLIVTNFSHLTVVDMDGLRRSLEKNNSKLVVAKNSLLKLALSEVKFDQANQFVDGMTGIAVYHQDPVSVTKLLFNFSRTHENFKILGGIVDGELVTENKAKELSQMPSKDVLRAMLVIRMKSPISGFINVLAGSLRGLIVVLDKISKQKVDDKGG